MGEKNRENLEKRIERSKVENRSLKETIASLRQTNSDLKRSLRDMNTFFDSIPAGVVLVQKGKILKINGELLEQLGYGADETIGRDFLDFVHPDKWKYVKRLQDTLDSGRPAPQQYDTCLVDSKGGIIDYEVRVRRIRFKGRRAFLLILNSLEKRKQEEKERIKTEKGEALHRGLSGLIGRLKSHDEHILDKVKARLKDSFKEEKDIEQTLNIVKDSLSQASDIAGDLEIIYQKERDQKGVVSFDINEIVKEAVEHISRRLAARVEGRVPPLDLTTYLRADSFATGDPEDIRDAVIYMVNNAVEAMPEGGDIHITTEENAGFIHVYIQDSGVGVPEKYGDKIYDPFFTTKGKESTGLGLSLSNAIIERNGGEIEMSSMEGEWTIFHFRLPMAKRSRKIKPRTDRKRIKEAQILIIQEEDIARELLSNLLSEKGCKVDTAYNGLEGLGKIKRQRYNLLIADLEASSSSVNSFLKKCKRINPKMSIALIGPAMEREDSDSMEVPGVDLAMRKPLDYDIVVRKVSELLMTI